jgi:hypothetical protein
MPAGRKSFEPTEQQRRMVESLAGCGLPQESIARIVAIDAKTLRKHFRQELDCGADKANAQVAGALFKMATSCKCVLATIFWMKTRLKWKDSLQLEHTAANGEMLSMASARAMLAEACLSRPKEDEDEQPITT